MCLSIFKTKRIATIKTFPCGVGDCIFMRLQDESNGDSFHIMIDCGMLSDDITNYICEVLECRIDLLIATHIDGDHIDGISAMLTDEPRLESLVIKQIIYNCYQHAVSDNKTPTPKEVEPHLNLLRNMFSNGYGSDISYKTSVSLGAILSKNPSLKSIWNTKLIDENSPSINLGKRWGKIHFLSPTPNALKRLYEKFTKEYASVVGVKIPNQPFEDIEETYELLLKLEGLRNRVFKGRKIAFDGFLDEQSLLESRIEDANEGSVDDKNKASLAFVWECRGHKVLFMGDAISTPVVKNLTKLYGEKTQLYDAVKISHHGSCYNTSSDLCEFVDSHVFFLTGGSENVGHDEECLAKILVREKNSNFHRILRYNVETKMMQTLSADNMENVRKDYNFELINDCDDEEYKFEY